MWHAADAAPRRRRAVTGCGRPARPPKQGLRGEVFTETIGKDWGSSPFAPRHRRAGHVAAFRGDRGVHGRPRWPRSPDPRSPGVARTPPRPARPSTPRPARCRRVTSAAQQRTARCRDDGSANRPDRPRRERPLPAGDCSIVANTKLQERADQARSIGRGARRHVASAWRHRPGREPDRGRQGSLSSRSRSNAGSTKPTSRTSRNSSETRSTNSKP